MSTPHPTSNRYPCANRECENTYQHGMAECGSFCTKACYHRHRGQKLLNIIQHNHRYCSHCGAELKEVEPPTDEQLRHISGFHSTTCVVGYQYQTRHADTGEIDVRDEPGKEVVATGTTCGRCGNANPTAEFPELYEFHPEEYGERILGALATEREQGAEVPDLDTDAFFETLHATADIRLALGHARRD